MIGKLSSNWNKWFAALLLNVYAVSFCAPLYAGGFHVATRADTGRNNKHFSVLEKFAKAPTPPALQGAVPGQRNGGKKKEEIKSDDLLLQKGYRISGPGQPEMSSFKSVGVDNMVNQFTGDFSYNIPLLDVGGYPINIFYNAGITMDQEASWVGLGWNLNPGTISRTMRGLPDDFNGGEDFITQENDIRDNIDVGIAAAKPIEIVGFNLSKTLRGTFEASKRLAVSYNSYVGFASELGLSNISARFFKVIQDEKTKDIKITKKPTLGGAVSFSSRSGMSFTPSLSFDLFSKDKQSQIGRLTTSVSYNSRAGLNNFHMDFQRMNSAKSVGNLFTSGGFTLNFASTAYTPSIRVPITNRNFQLQIQTGTESAPLFKPKLSFEGYYTQSFIKKEDRSISKPAYGYLNMQNANGNEEAILDFNRLNDGGYVEGKTSVLSMPQYTYDVFNISGEGTGGSFRAYRGDIGYVHDAYSSSRSAKGSLGVDFGKSNTTTDINIGLNITGTGTTTFVNEWEHQNNTKEAVYFRKPVGADEPVYFRNPGETTSATDGFYDKVAGDKLVRLELYDHGSPFLPFPEATSNLLYYNDGNRQVPATGPEGQALKLPLSAAISDKAANRDKRSQVISYLTAKEASKVGFDNKLRVYKGFNILTPFTDGNTFTEIDRTNSSGNVIAENYRQANHISEIDVVEQDGKRYIYGLPVYNIIQKDVTFAAAKTNADKSKDQVIYNNDGDAGDNNLDGDRLNLDSKDRYYNAQIIPAYAHSFLLTELLSPDYSDVTGDGISGDDIGTAVKFNYRRVGTPQNNNWPTYKWRTPAEHTANVATYNEGLKTDKSDDKAFYSYGEKELWYTHSIESKSMVAIFRTTDRDDALPVINENGGIDEMAPAKLQRLDKIDLYSKADLVKRGNSAKPIKTVHFVYGNGDGSNDYTLCEKVSNSKLVTTAGVTKRLGKLTLSGIYFTYNGSSTSQKHKYVFRYNEGYNEKKFDYDRTKHDAWGNLKDSYIPTDYNQSTPVTGPEISRLPAGIVTPSDFPFALQAENANRASNLFKSQKEAIDAFAGAWNLREIDLPSGATIKVNYETDEYAFVQNKPAAQMMQVAGFSSANTTGPGTILYGNAFERFRDYKYVFFNVPDPIVNITNSKAEINKRYLAGIDQLLLKLYIEVPKDAYGRGAEPVTVYSKMEGTPGNYTCGLVGNNVNGHPQIWIQLAGNSNGDCSVVESVFQFLRDHLSSKVFFGSDVGMDGAPMQIIKSTLGMIASIADLGGETAKFKTLGYGKSIKPELCFGRLSNPVGAKFGGGHRVKSIIIKDNWNLLTSRGANGAAAAPIPEAASTYGQEYDYTTSFEENGVKKAISSGVASYEPSAAGEENPFRQMIQYKTTEFMGPSSFGSVELPVAEGFYPSAMVGYSKVRVKSINNKTNLNKDIKGGVGVQETEYFTTKDFPTLSDYTALDNKSHYSYKPSAIDFFLKFWSVRYNTLSQGFRVQLNNMNGKIKQQSSYPENDPDHPLQYTKYFYRQKSGTDNMQTLKNSVDVVKDATGVVSEQTIGKDIELMMDFREHNATSYSGNLKMNIEFKQPTLIFPSFYIPFTFNQSIFRSVTVSKIINTYGVLERVETYDKGSKVNTDNLVYEAESGAPLVTSTTNAFNKPVYSFSYPAHWAYDGMGPAYKNIGVQYEHVFIRNGFIESGFVDQNLLQSGDELYVYDAQLTGVPDNYFCPSGVACPPPKPKSTASKIWVIDLSKSTDPGFLYSGNRRIMLLERDGTPYNGGDVYMRVIRSGRRNLLGASVGAVSSVVSPKTGDATSGYKIAFGADNILNAGAAIFKEVWRTDDAFYVTNEITRVDKVYTVKNKRLPVNRVMNVEYHLNKLSSLFTKRYPEFFLAPNQNNFGGRHTSFSDNARYPYGDEKNKHTFQSLRSWIDFDLSTIPVAAQIISGKLGLGAQLENQYSYSNVQLIHDATNPHRNGNYYPSNALLIEAMRTPWYDPISVNWKTNFGVDPNNDPAVVDMTTFAMIPPTMPFNWYSSKSYYGSDAIDVTSAFRELHKNRAAPGNTFATGFRLRPMIIAPYGGGPDNGIRQYFNKTALQSQCRTYNYSISQGGLGGTIEYIHCSSGNTIQITNGSGSFCAVSGGYTISGDVVISTQDLSCDVPTQALSFLDVKYYETNPYVAPSPGDETITVSSYELAPQCNSVFSKTKFNPYVHGMLGNWRAFKSYVFFDDRKQGHLSADIDLHPNNSSDGTLNAFAPFWGPYDPVKKAIAPSGNVKWVWNSAIAQVNKRGMEIENYDPLGRYNAAVYGYNQSLPVAVVNNAHFCESAFDGFEDYSFSDEFVTASCKEKRHFDLGITSTTAGIIDDKEHHTGKYSLKIVQNATNNATHTVTVPLKLYDGADPMLMLEMDLSPSPITRVTLNGTGLVGKYYESQTTHTYTKTGDYPTVFIDAKKHKPIFGSDYYEYLSSTLPVGFLKDPDLGNINDHHERWENIKIEWNGFIQVEKSDTYTFNFNNAGTSFPVDDYGEVKIYDIARGVSLDCRSTNSNRTVYLEAGKPYHMDIVYRNDNAGGGHFNLDWKSGCDAAFKPVPQLNMYPTLEAANGTWTTATVPCGPKRIKMTGNNILTDRFTPIPSNQPIPAGEIVPGSKLVLSAWVKEQAATTTTTHYANNAIVVSFLNSAGAVIGSTGVMSKSPTGIIIEGWQRYDFVLPVIPLLADKMRIAFTNTSSGAVYFDDIRIHPFNGNMKSFVYDPVNLRLRAELDENNYASFYEYDDEGTVTRIKKETKEGIKTIQETRSALRQNQ
ncbi:MAG: PA14 domain-containing protein [Bacteroidota bacterium]